MADGEQTVELAKSRYPEHVVTHGAYRDQHWVEIKATGLQQVARWLRDDPATAYEMLTDVTAVHWPDDPLPVEVVYHFTSLSRNDRLRVKVRTSDRGPVPTLSQLWNSADWNEREAYDMLGVEFSGHPDLRRILMPDDYTDHPLRKELPLYRG